MNVSLIFIASACLLCFSCSPVQAGGISGDEIVTCCKYVAERCANFDLVKTLDAFVEFYSKYTQVNQHLRSASSKKMSPICKEAEESCAQNGILFPNVQALGELLQKFQTKGQIVCTMAYSINLYKIHQQLSSVEHDLDSKRLLRVLRSLANRWALRCQSSIKSRLIEVEQRAPDSIKHIAFVVNLLFLGISKVALLPLEPDHYVPVLEGEELNDVRGSSVGRGPSGFEFKLTQQVRVALDGARMSCRALRPYHVNILGSLGLMASIGYGLAPELRGAHKTLDSESRETRSLMRKWIISAILCQSLGGLLKQAAVSTDNKQTLRLKVLPLERAEVPRVIEDEIGFDELALTETTENKAIGEADLSSLDSYVHKPNKQAQLRKLQLITGPNYGLASAIYAYLDLTQLQDRYKIPFAILNLQVPKEDPFKDVKEKDDDDDDEEEEEEDEE